MEANRAGGRRALVHLDDIVRSGRRLGMAQLSVSAVANGRIVEDGTVEELQGLDGRFAEFWRQQHAAADWHLAGP